MADQCTLTCGRNTSTQTYTQHLKTRQAETLACTHILTSITDTLSLSRSLFLIHTHTHTHTHCCHATTLPFIIDYRRAW